MTGCQLREPRWRLAVLALIVATAAGCGAGDEPQAAQAPQSGDVTVTPGPDGVQAVTLVTQDNFRYIPARFIVTPGPVRLTLENPSGTVHNLRYDEGGPEEEIPVVRSAESETIEFTVSTPGEYEFICTFHEQFGQRGTMVVVRS